MSGEEAAPPWRRTLYGRRQGPKLRPGRRRLLDQRLPDVAIPLVPGQRLDPLALFGWQPQALWLEIGFGGGEHLAVQAHAHPEIGFLGVEPFRNGVAKLLEAIETQDLRNVRLLTDDARLLLDALPDASIERAFVLFPDPWPKARHHKRRIVNPATAAALGRVVRPGGELRLATDDPGYARWMLATLLAETSFTWTAERAADWREPPPDWAPTRYEAKARTAGRRPIFLSFRRLAATSPDRKDQPMGATGERDLAVLLSSMQPVLREGVFVFCTRPPGEPMPSGLEPLMTFREDEGMTLVLTREEAAAAGLEGVFPARMITLGIHSALDAVGFLAAVTGRLARDGVSVNPVSAFHHDHLFVPAERAEEALRILLDLAAAGRAQSAPGPASTSRV